MRSFRNERGNLHISELSRLAYQIQKANIASSIDRTKKKCSQPLITTVENYWDLIVFFIFYSYQPIPESAILIFSRFYYKMHL